MERNPHAKKNGLRFPNKVEGKLLKNQVTGIFLNNAGKKQLLVSYKIIGKYDKKMGTGNMSINEVLARLPDKSIREKHIDSYEYYQRLNNYEEFIYDDDNFPN